MNDHGMSQGPAPGWVAILMALAALIAFAGCDAAKPQAEYATANEYYRVALLFEHEGCRVYRFRDDGYSRYFTSCPGATLGGHAEGCGKGCTRWQPDDIPTGVR